MKKIDKFLGGVGLLIAQAGFAHGPQPMPLIDVPIPHVQGSIQEKNTQGSWVDTANVNFLPTDGSDPIVINKEKAIALGKALFWDTSVGSDGMACGSCHFHAGTDARVKNQMNPGVRSNLASGQTFESLPSGVTSGGPNYTLTHADFPTYQYNQPLDKQSGVKFSTDDVISSSGPFNGTYTGASKFTGFEDQCEREVDPVFHIGATGTRHVTTRNAPTVFNAVFNYRNFWDGRANNIFNGSSNWGDRDENAGVWLKNASKSQPVKKVRLHLENAALASLALAPPLDTLEMACSQRSWPEIGRKLLLRQPLQNQKVHNEDSVLGPLSLSEPGNLKPGLNTTYKQLVMQAFNNKYWSYAKTGPFGAKPGQAPYNQLEANFSMFFGIALQLYQSTLVSDQAPIDITTRDPIQHLPTWQNLGYDEAKIARLNNGIGAFTNNHCNLCHSGPNLTTAAIVPNSTLLQETGDSYGPAYARIPYGINAIGGDAGAYAAGISSHINLVNRDVMSGTIRMYDMGFANTGVNNPTADLGLDAVDDFGNPLSYSSQYVQYLLGNSTNIKDSGAAEVRTCDFIVPLAYEDTAKNNVTFTSPNGIQPDGEREGVLRNQDCIAEDNAFIPTVAAANAAYTPGNPSYAPAKLSTVTKGVFKIPSLRNIELTGPYMHNGSMSTLQQVLEFYSRKGNFDSTNKHQFVNNITIGSSASQRADLIEFLETLTDERVRYEKAPFDHPEIKVTNGHPGDQFITTSGNPLSANMAMDEYLEVPAVGANGSAAKLLPFYCQLGPLDPGDSLYEACQP